MTLSSTDTASPPSSDVLRRIRLQFLRRDAERRQRTLALLGELERVEELLRSSALRTEQLVVSKRACETKVAHLFHVPTGGARARTSVLPVSPVSRASSVKSDSQASLVYQSDNDGRDSVVSDNREQHGHNSTQSALSVETGGSDTDIARESGTVRVARCERVDLASLDWPIETEFQALQTRSEALRRFLLSDAEWNWRLQPIGSELAVSMTTDDITQQTNGTAGVIRRSEDSVDNHPCSAVEQNVDQFSAESHRAGIGDSGEQTHATPISEHGQLIVPDRLIVPDFHPTDINQAMSNCSDTGTEYKSPPPSFTSSKLGSVLIPLEPPSSSATAPSRLTNVSAEGTSLNEIGSDQLVPAVAATADENNSVGAFVSGSRHEATFSVTSVPPPTTEHGKSSPPCLDRPESHVPPPGTSRSSAVLASLGTIQKTKSPASSRSSSSSSSEADGVLPQQLASSSLLATASRGGRDSGSDSLNLNEEHVDGEDREADAQVGSDDDFWG